MWKIEAKIKNNFDKNKTRVDYRNISKLIVPFENDKKKKSSSLLSPLFSSKFEDVSSKCDRLFIERKEMEDRCSLDGGRSWRSVAIGSMQFPCRKSMLSSGGPVAKPREREKREVVARWSTNRQKPAGKSPSCPSSTIYLALLNLWLLDRWINYVWQLQRASLLLAFSFRKCAECSGYITFLMHIPRFAYRGMRASILSLP